MLLSWLNVHAGHDFVVMTYLVFWATIRCTLGSLILKGLLSPAFVACSTNVGEGLVKLSRVQCRTWTCGGVAHSQKNCKWVRVLPIANTDHRTTEHSVSDSLSDVSWVQKAAYSCTECATPPHIQVHHCTWLSFTRPSPVLVLQATTTGVRRPGYEPIHWPHPS